MALCEKILENCIEKYRQESFLGYVCSIHPVLLRKAQRADELIRHFLWLESKDLVVFKRSSPTHSWRVSENNPAWAEECPERASVMSAGTICRY